jgi:hypothetical protein
MYFSARVPERDGMVRHDADVDGVHDSCFAWLGNCCVSGLRYSAKCGITSWANVVNDCCEDVESNT